VQVDAGATFICGTGRIPPLNPMLIYAKDQLKLETRIKRRDTAVTEFYKQCVACMWRPTACRGPNVLYQWASIECARKQPSRAISSTLEGVGPDGCTGSSWLQTVSTTQAPTLTFACRDGTSVPRDVCERGCKVFNKLDGALGKIKRPYDYSILDGINDVLRVLDPDEQVSHPETYAL
jgi:hypothetical protein